MLYPTVSIMPERKSGGSDGESDWSVDDPDREVLAVYTKGSPLTIKERIVIGTPDTDTPTHDCSNGDCLFIEQEKVWGWTHHKHLGKIETGEETTVLDRIPDLVTERL